jgi:hypothetical protein
MAGCVTKRKEKRMPASVYSRTLQKASELSGGQKKLARLLRVPQSDLENWIADKDEPPMAIFLRAVDLVLDETGAPAAGSEPGEPSPPKDCASGAKAEFGV